MLKILKKVDKDVDSDNSENGKSILKNFDMINQDKSRVTLKTIRSRRNIYHDTW